MWSQIVLCLFVGLAYASTNPAWKDNAEYVYMVRGRTLASLFEVSNQYSGILMKAKLRIQPKPDGKLLGQISDAQYSQVHTHLQEWNMYIPDAELSWKSLELTKEPFQVEMKSGVITDVIVNKDISNWEANFIRSILSQFQLNTSESSEVSSESFPNSAVYNTMEDTVTGNVDTLYKINAVPEYIVRSKPWGQKIINLKGSEQVIEVMKHKNYSSSIELPVYSHGFGSTRFGKPGTNAMGLYLLRDSTSRAILFGSLKKYTIHHSYTFSKIMANPTLQDKQKGAVHSLMNVTLEEMKGIDQPITPVSQPVRLGNLVYSYGIPYAHEDKVQEKSPYEQQMKLGGKDYLKANRMMRNGRWRRSLELDESRESNYQDNSEESYKKPQPKIEEAPETPLLPFTIGFSGLSIKKVENVVKIVKSLAQEIGIDVQEPKRNFQETLSKFTTLGSLLRVLNAQEMESAATELYSNDNEGPKRDAWQVFRDSVAECGTGPALMTIQNWIRSQKIKKAEAALVIVTMMRAARQPSVRYMKTLFELVKSEEVQSHWPLNVTAILTYADFVHKVYLHPVYSEMQYPGKSFEKFGNEEGRKFVEESVIPYYIKKLHEAVEKGESREIIAFIVANGNIGHPSILRAYEPYLEGKKQCSQFQRMTMMYSLVRLAFVHPIPTRNVLFRVYQNIGEEEEVRAAAVSTLMLTLPPREMLQYMASYTNVDVHEHVNAIVKNSIVEFSETKYESLKHFREAAISARPLLTKKEYGMQYATVKGESQVIKQLGYKHEDELLLMGAHESFIPEIFRVSRVHNLKGHREHLWNIAGGVSSIDELFHVLKLQTEEYTEDRKQQNQNYNEQKQNKWSSQYIASLLNLETHEREQLEGAIIGGFNGPLGMISFDNRSIEQYTRDFVRYEEELKQGKKINFIKLINNRPLALSFPTEMGLPFLFTRESPILIKAKGTLKAVSRPQVFQNQKIHKPESIEIESDMSVIVSGKRQGQLSFVTPFDHHQYVAGYDKHWQVYAPLNAKVEVNVKESQVKAEITPCHEENEASLFQYSTHPYTSRIDISHLRPMSAQPNTQPIEQSNLRTFDKIIGEHQTGLALRVQIRHEREFIDAPRVNNLLREEGIVGTFMGLWEDSEIQQSQINITHVVPKSTTRKFVIRLGKQEEYYKSGDSSERQVTESDNSQQRQIEAMKKAAAGIKSVRSQAYDASVEFQGEKTIKYHLTGAFAKSNVDPKSRLLVEFQRKSDKHDLKPYMLAFEAKNEVPNTNGLDLEYSMEKEPRVDSDMKLIFGESTQDASKVQATWEFRRSEERKQFLREQPLYQQCQQDQRKGNKQTAACLNMTIESNFLDRVKAKIQYQNVKPELQEVFRTAYYGVRWRNLPSIEIDYEDKCSQNEIDMRAAFDPDLRSANISIKTPEEKTIIRNYLIDEWTKQITVLHPVYHLRSRLIAKSLGIPEYRPSCVVDKSVIKTFTNMSYPAKISQQWTVMVQYIPKEARHEEKPNSIEEQLKNQVENFVILVRQNPQQGDKKDLKITLSTPETDLKVIEITMTPEQSGNVKAKVSVNGQQVQVSDRESYDIAKGYIQIYALPNGEVKFEVKDVFYTIYDGERIRVNPTSGILKGDNRGICGQFTNNKVEDFVTPSECYVKDVMKFVKSYEIEGQDGQSVRQELSSNAKECVHKRIPLYVNVVESKSEQLTGRCSFFQTRYIEQNDEICFTIRSMPVCRSECQPQGTITKDVPVHCIQNTPVAQLWKNQIEKGANPDFSHKKPTKSVPMQLPEGCAE